MVKAGGKLTGIGFDYKIAKPLKVYLNYVDKSFNPSRLPNILWLGFSTNSALICFNK